jgi:hypothetical protein
VANVFHFHNRRTRVERRLSDDDRLYYDLETASLALALALCPVMAAIVKNELAKYTSDAHLPVHRPH